MITLRNWCVKLEDSDGYTAPEMIERYLVGEVFGHPKHEDGKAISTSPIDVADGRDVKTLSGTVYRLDGEPRADYAKWMADTGYRYDPAAPIGMGFDSRKIKAGGA